MGIHGASAGDLVAGGLHTKRNGRVRARPFIVEATQRLSSA
jgi:hypothetical protein